MAWFIVRSEDKGDHGFPITRLPCVIGRSRRSSLVLPHVSVSRQHCSVELDDNGLAILTDLESQNGTRVNGERVRLRLLQTGDRVQVGTFALVYVGVDVWPAVHEGVNLGRLPYWRGPWRRTVDGPTQNLDSASDLRNPDRLATLEASVVALDRSGGWRPGERGLRFGRSGDVPVPGAITPGVLAEIIWTGSAHVLLRRSRFNRLLLNDTAVDEEVLDFGDVIRIGNGAWEYRAAS